MCGKVSPARPGLAHTMYSEIMRTRRPHMKLCSWFNLKFLRIAFQNSSRLPFILSAYFPITRLFTGLPLKIAASGCFN